MSLKTILTKLFSKALLCKLDFSRTQFDKDIQNKSLYEKPHLFVWDEPLNFVDIISRIQIEELILKYTPTLLFIEHDKIFCYKIATKIIEL